METPEEQKQRHKTETGDSPLMIKNSMLITLRLLLYNIFLLRRIIWPSIKKKSQIHFRLPLQP